MIVHNSKQNIEMSALLCKPWPQMDIDQDRNKDGKQTSTVGGNQSLRPLIVDTALPETNEQNK